MKISSTKVGKSSLNNNYKNQKSEKVRKTWILKKTEYFSPFQTFVEIVENIGK